MGRVRLSVAERRAELLRAAIEQIEARGVAAVRISDVAAVLGVSSALVLYHFSTKERLVAEAFRHAAEDDLARLRKLLGRRTTALRRPGGRPLVRPDRPGQGLAPVDRRLGRLPPRTRPARGHP